MGESLFWGRLARLALLGLMGALCLLSVSGARAFAQKAHVFDPVLSLTGGCTTSPVDSVADPGPCPGVAGVDHPNVSFSAPTAVTTDSWGNIFIANFGQASSGSEGRIDIFDSAGFFVTELAATGPRSLAVDSNGNLFVIDKEDELLRYEPTAYEPAKAEIKYGKAPVVVAGPSASTFVGLAVNRLNDHVFANYGTHITEFGSAAEESKAIDETIGAGVLPVNPHGIGLAIDASRGRIYASDLAHSGKVPDPSVVRVFELEKPHALVETIDGSTTPSGKFLNSKLSLAVEESTGNLFVYDGEGAEVVYELTEHGEYLGAIEEKIGGHAVFGAEIGVDNGENSPNGQLNPSGRSYLFVPAYPSSVGHSFAFAPPSECPPEVEEASFTGVTETEAQLQAQVNPCHLDTTYTFEYTTQESYETEGFSGAAFAGEGEIPAGGAPVEVAAGVEGLTPGTTYRFRVRAENVLGDDEGEGQFATYPEVEISSCPNEPLRTGASALLPDCRAYELVTPPDTNARSPLGVDHLGTYFTTSEASPAGDKVSFEIEGGTIPGYEATGSYAGDPYLATRGADGWHTSYVGPSGGEAPALLPGSNSPDQGYSFWSTANGEGSAGIEGNSTNYVRYPDGHSALVGRGSLGTDPRAVGRLISEGGRHILFETGVIAPPVQLEENAPPSGTKAVYDRTIDPVTGEEETHVVSLLPGNVAPSAGEGALFQGASPDGKGVGFSIGNTLYLRYEDKETFEVAKEAIFAGVAEGGHRIFYLKGGNLFAFDVEAEETIQFSESGDVTPVNVAAEGGVAYFISPSVLVGEPNPNGAKAQAGKQNLYRSEAGAIAFVGTVTEADVESGLFGLGLWTTAIGPSGGAPGKLAIDPSRATPDGNVLLFESRAALSGYDPEGHTEVYRYDASTGTLHCLSCNPTLAAATGEASLESIAPAKGEAEPFGPYALVANLRDDGGRAFFQSTEPLVAGDTDELQDVYEWEAQGVGTCVRPGGCVYLISSGQSRRPDYIYAVSASGADVFFRSSDLLLASDRDETPSIYDARIDSGFPEKEIEEECQGEGCRPGVSAPPFLELPASPAPGARDNVRPSEHCPRGKRKVTKNGKPRCVKKHHRSRHRKAGSKKKGAAR
ncbi:MAG: hypothetical protein ACTHNP_10530 [Solirubrobacterales bacterium]